VSIDFSHAGARASQVGKPQPHRIIELVKVEESSNERDGMAYHDSRGIEIMCVKIEQRLEHS